MGEHAIPCRISAAEIPDRRRAGLLFGKLSHLPRLGKSAHPRGGRQNGHRPAFIYPVDDQGKTILIQDVRYYSPKALAAIDPGLIVTPPAGLEAGYVPIVTRQEAPPLR